jgi:hypothetical protein
MGMFGNSGNETPQSSKRNSAQWLKPSADMIDPVINAAMNMEKKEFVEGLQAQVYTNDLN